MDRRYSPPADMGQQLHNLRAFLSVAEAKSITHASEHLFKASSAIARSVMELERFVGAALFERRPRGMLINTYGEAVLMRARRLNAEIEAAADEFSGSSSKASRPLRNAVVNLLFSGRKLQFLIRLAELKSVSGVAAQMNMTQSGASMALSRIESMLGQSLFQRRMEGMVPTEATERMVMRGRRVLAELRHLNSDLSAIAGYLTGAVIIGATPLGRTHYYPNAMAATISKHPGIMITSVEGAYDQLIGSLRSGEIDIVFGVLRPPHLSHGLLIEPLFTDQMTVLARAGHPLARRPHLQMGELLREKWVSPRPNAPGKPQVDECFLRLGLEPPTPSVETGDLATLRQLLSASDMLAVTSAHQFMYEIQSGLLVELPVNLAGAALEVGLIVRDGALLSPAALAVVDAVRDQARQRQGLH
ncbi:MAG TPA: LysR family transcriptional regulator [Caulobacteraceae bacterium]|nr:LysR family transcriptional regulator [Caulobacteraceae bacterium]